MRNLFILPALVCTLTSNAQPYSKADSAKARAYFDSSWRYRMGSHRHQQYLDSALMVMPTNAWYWQQKAMPLYKAQKYEEGKPYLDSAVKYDPREWLAYRGFMECIFSRSYRAAIKDFHAAAALRGVNNYEMDHPYKFYLGLCHLQSDNLDSSEYYFNSCIEDERAAHGDDFVHYNHWFYRGIVCYEKEQYAEAITYFDKSLKVYKQFSDAKYYKAACLGYLKKADEAKKLMDEAYADFKEGYTMPEDNALYELYPYQVRKYYYK